MKKKVLVVDNSPVVLRLLTNMLQKENYEVKTAEDGLGALEVIEQFIPDIMIIDLIMPKINGEKLCRIIRKMPEFDSTYLIIISAIATEEKIDFLSFGANACIAKGPFKPMLKHIATVLDHLNNSEFESLTKHIFGAESIFEREITKELLATKKHFEITLNNMSDGFLELTSNASIIYANKASTQFLGIPEENLLSTYFPNLFLTEQNKLIADIVSNLSDSPVEIGEDVPIILHDRYLLIKLVPFFDRDQKFIIVLIQDITKRKQAEIELIKHRERLEEQVVLRTVEYEETNVQLQNEIVERLKVQDYLEYSIKHWRQTFDVMSDFVSVHDHNMMLVKVNKAFADLFGKKPKELIGKHCYELMHNAQVPLPTCPHLKAIEKQCVVTEETENQHLGKTLLITCSPIFDKKGDAIGTVHVARDTTSQKLAQVERDALVKKLQTTLDEIKMLRGILPICSYCKNIRNDKGYYEQIEGYIHKHSGVDFSHTICPKCLKEHHPEEYKNIILKKKG